MARAENCYRNYDLRRSAYQRIKAEHGLGAQAAQHVIKKVADAYRALAANLTAGRYGKSGSKRRARLESRPVQFRWDAAQPYDARMLSWQHDARTVSIWTTAGRLKDVVFTGSSQQLEAVATLAVGECDLVHRNGLWFLRAAVEHAEADVYVPDGFVGVDMGIINIAYTSDGVRHAGGCLNGYRRRQQRIRSRLQSRNTQSVKRLLRKRRKREARHAANINHTIAKRIVAEAARTGRGIAVEDLTGIRDRVRLRKPQRVTLNSWSFGQLGDFLAYKARRAGVPFIQVDPRYTSQICNGCQYLDKRNRLDQETFVCRSCGVVAHADHNAALNIARRGVEGWAAVNLPNVA